MKRNQREAGTRWISARNSPDDDLPAVLRPGSPLFFSLLTLLSFLFYLSAVSGVPTAAAGTGKKKRGRGKRKYVSSGARGSSAKALVPEGF